MLLRRYVRHSAGLPLIKRRVNPAERHEAVRQLVREVGHPEFPATKVIAESHVPLRHLELAKPHIIYTEPDEYPAFASYALDPERKIYIRKGHPEIIERAVIHELGHNVADVQPVTINRLRDNWKISGNPDLVNEGVADGYSDRYQNFVGYGGLEDEELNQVYKNMVTSNPELVATHLSGKTKEDEGYGVQWGTTRPGADEWNNEDRLLYLMARAHTGSTGLIPQHPSVSSFIREVGSNPVVQDVVRAYSNLHGEQGGFTRTEPSGRKIGILPQRYFDIQLDRAIND